MTTMSRTNVNKPADEKAMDKLVKRHPLQRISSPSRSVSAMVHILGLASFAYSFKYLADNPNHINSAYGWHFQYLTIIGLFLATLTFTAGITADTTLTHPPFLAKNILSICSAPMAILISLLYWGLRAIDPTLVVPKELELPLTPDLGFHASPAFFLLIDLLFLSPPWTITALPALGLSTIIAFGYWFWIELCYRHNGFYPYPLFDVLNYGQRVGLFGGCAVVMAGVTVVLRLVYEVVNGRVEGADRFGRERVGDVKN